MKYLLLILVVGLLQACSKSNRNHRRIQHQWSCNLVKIEDGNGFVYYDTLSTTNAIQFTVDSVTSFFGYEYVPLGASSTIDDTLSLKDNYSIEGDIITLLGSETEIKIKLLTNSEMVLAYYDALKYKLKTFYFQR